MSWAVGMKPTKLSEPIVLCLTGRSPHSPNQVFQYSHASWVQNWKIGVKGGCSTIPLARRSRREKRKKKFRPLEPKRIRTILNSPCRDRV